jgi:GT2 family glycosyltransferase
VERLNAFVNNNVLLNRSARPVTRVGMGVLGATGAMISKPVWSELNGFDERYQAGGEDTALAKSMLQRGYQIVDEPAMIVHHSHGLNARNFFKQWMGWARLMKGPRQFDRKRLLQRRPDLRPHSGQAST